MGFGNLFGSSRGNSTTASTTDNSVRSTQTSADGGSIVAGEAASINVTSNVQTVDPGSYQFASELIKDTFNAQRVTQQTAAETVSKTQDTVAKLAQGSPLGLDWKALALPLGIVAALGLLLFGAARRK